MTMTGMSMDARGWLGAYAWFVGRWSGMMVAMMLPSLLPRLWCYGRATTPTRPAGRVDVAALAGVGYVAIWGIVGGLVYPAGVAFRAMRGALPALAHATPLLVGAVVACAGALQFTAWKSRHLACWQAPVRADGAVRHAARDALWHGARLGVHCLACGAGLTAVLLVVGSMDLRVMALATAAVTVERLAPAGERVARVIGAVGLAVGVVMMARAVGGGHSARVHEPDLIGPVGHHAQKLERRLDHLVAVRGAGRDVQRVIGAHLVHRIADADARSAP